MIVKRQQVLICRLLWEVYNTSTTLLNIGNYTLVHPISSPCVINCEMKIGIIFTRLQMNLQPIYARVFGLKSSWHLEVSVNLLYVQLSLIVQPLGGLRLTPSLKLRRHEVLLR